MDGLAAFTDCEPPGPADDKRETFGFFPLPVCRRRHGDGFTPLCLPWLSG